MTPSNNTIKNKIDVVIPYHEKDSKIIEMCICGCIKNVKDCGKIYVISNSTDLESGNIKLIDENGFFNDGLSRKHIKLRWTREYPTLAHRTGWLFQQFIKMGCSYSIPNLTDYYLVVDSDVIFLKRVHFFRNGRMLLTKSKEFHQPYFDCYERLLGEPANTEYSFIAHHMLISKAVMLELLNKIEKRFNKTWYDAILDNLEYKEGSIFSEYETYGHYLKNHYPEKFIARKLKNVQRFKIRYMLQILLNQVDYVTIHNYKKPQHNPKTNPQTYKLFVNLVRSRVQTQKRKAGLTLHNKF